MESTTLPAGEFKATCLALMDEVGATGREIIITKRGKPVAKLVPVRPAFSDKPLRGLLKDSLRIVGDLQKPLVGVEYDLHKKFQRLEAEADQHRARRATRKATR